VLAAQAPGAQVKLLGLTIYCQGNRVDIRHPTTVGTPFRMADIMTELRGFAAQITLQYLFSLEY
jgi:hypothetical protein